MDPQIPRNCYSPRLPVISPKGQEPAQQQFKQDCDINTIMQRLHKNEAINHVSKYQTEYGFTSPTSYHQSLNIITRADSMFNDLPSKVRNEFANNPQAFLAFVQDPKNQDRAKELGIALTIKAAKAAEAAGPPKKPEEVVPSPEEPGTAPVVEKQPNPNPNP